ncbi:MULTISPECIES: hypothetical protein [Burkholderia]|uniref:hypothetical protein n=1 Tax=Burkholderia TaxID=32008 RepID=UPI0021BFE168|nr:hypothetical protein [Burkholderia multivorans]MCA8225084.1 hypothetical protein [Burkholderia multivorans]
MPQKDCTEPLGLLRQVIKTIDKAIPGDWIKFSLKQYRDNLRLGAAAEADLGDALKCRIDLHGEG